jgi:hypothetical protein
MYDLRLTRLLLQPSFVSGAFLFCWALFLIAYNGWLYIDEQQLFYNYLFGAHGLKTYVWQYSQHVTAWQSAFLGSPAAYYALVGAVATAAGLIVYCLLQLLGLVSHGIGEGWERLQDKERKPSASKSVANELLTRLALRVISLICWGIYAAFFFSTMVPFISVLNRVGIDLINSGHSYGLAVCFGTLLLLFFSLHLHVIFLRLILLRPRVFGGERVIEQAKAEADTHDQRDRS